MPRSRTIPDEEASSSLRWHRLHDKRSERRIRRLELLAQGLKRCSKCGEVKSLHDFNQQISSSDEHQAYDRDCAARAHKEWLERMKVTAS